MNNRPFLIDGDPAKEVMDRWARQGIICELVDMAVGESVVVRNYTWPTPDEFGNEVEHHPEVIPPEALDELGQYYDEILSHLRYWKQTRERWERIHQQHATCGDDENDEKITE